MNKSMESIFNDLENLKPQDASPQETIPVTFWIPESAKRDYDEIQKITGQQLSKKAIDMLVAFIAEAKAKLKIT